MGRTVKDPCNHVVSFRLNKEDLDKLNHWTETTGMNLSALMRKIIGDAPVPSAKSLHGPFE